MTDGPLMDADCIHGNAWYDCPICWPPPQDDDKVCPDCGEATEDGACINPFCERWRFGEEFDRVVEGVKDDPEPTPDS